jgi:bifunctional DNA-binding transcriptional regulator/antitoxin component of YhaV-PrlF toxin-antitoxin module
MQLHTHIDHHGRLLIPSIIRKKLKYQAGDTLAVRVVNGELRILSIDKVVEEAQDLIKKLVNQKGSLVDEFIELKNQERKDEELRFKKNYGKKS